MMERMKSYRRGDVFYADLGEGKGNVQGGIRPVIIIQNDKGNEFSPNVIVAPITSKVHSKAKLPTHVELNYKYIGLNQPSMALLENPVTISKKDVKQFVGRLSKEDIEKINEGLKISLELKYEEINIKIEKIEDIDNIFKMAVQANSINDEFATMLQEERGALIKDLEDYCKTKGLNAMDFLSNNRKAC